MLNETREKGMQNTYIHGYDQRESRRLQDQASTLVELLHADTFYPEGSRVLEAGCGVGGACKEFCVNDLSVKVQAFCLQIRS